MRFWPIILRSLLCAPCFVLALVPHDITASRDIHANSSIEKDCGCSNPFLIRALERIPALAASSDTAEPEPPRAHDPTMAFDHGSYYLYTTGPGIPFSRSKDRMRWEPAGKAFARPMPWTAGKIPGSGDIYWAPNIVQYNGKWLLFYAVSTFGHNRSVIGMASNTTLDPDNREYSWKDEGMIVESQRTDNWNAIDPNFAVDASGNPWLAAGSFWSGIKLIPLDRTTCKPKGDVPEVLAIAQRPNTPEIRGAIEAPYIFRHGDYYFLFASFDFCCRGINSTYNVRVGRSKTISGPYVDASGVSMLDGGGTQVLFPSSRWKGPGHNCILTVKRKEYIVYHAYDALDRGMSKLQMSPIVWSKSGWPTVTASESDSHP